jgi:hypothetical protein
MRICINLAGECARSEGLLHDGDPRAESIQAACCCAAESARLHNDPRSKPTGSEPPVQSRRDRAVYSDCLRLVRDRATPLTQSLKLVHYLHWPDLLQLSVNVSVHAQVRRAVEAQLLIRLETLSLGERIAAAKRCSNALIEVFLFDRDAKVFRALLLNQRLREEDLLLLAESAKATAEKLQLLADDRKWFLRYAIRRALVMNPSTPRAAAALQLRFLSHRDLVIIHQHPSTSTYLRRCIERLRERVFVRMAAES